MSRTVPPDGEEFCETHIDVNGQRHLVHARGDNATLLSSCEPGTAVEIEGTLGKEQWKMKRNHERSLTVIRVEKLSVIRSDERTA